MKTAHQYSLITLCALALLQACSGSSSGGGGGNNQNPDQNFPTETVPDQNSMDLTASVLNPEGWSVSGTTSEITVRLADHLNDRTVLNGTEIFFSTEGGSIDDFCVIEDGACKVTFTSQNPRPANGRTKILAWATGNESFIDNNANGFFDDGDGFPANFDLPEPFRDDNENGVRDIDEPFFDFDGDSSFDGPDGLYSGTNCAHSILCAPSQTLFIFDSIELVMSGSTAFISFNPPGPISLPSTVTVSISDVNGNPMPADSEIEITASVGEIDPDITVMPSTNAPGGLIFDLFISAAASGEVGTLKVRVTTPGGATTSSIISLQDTPAAP